ncbi:MAG: hypothetical protein GHCLOJNM_02613 [bacterium]|nr:hypothetical protein [bacterium]
MASAGRNQRGNRARASLILLVLLRSGVVGAEEFLFSDLRPARYFAPPFEIEDDTRRLDTDQLKAEIEDFEERLKKGWRVDRQLWRAREVGGVTICVIRDLVQGASLRFEFATEWSGRGNLELALPRAPDQGPIAVWFNERPALALDPWSDRPEPVRGFQGEGPVEVRTGTNTLRIIQRSPQDLPIRLHSLRLAPLAKDPQAEPGLTP